MTSMARREAHPKKSFKSPMLLVMLGLVPFFVPHYLLYIPSGGTYITALLYLRWVVSGYYIVRVFFRHRLQILDMIVVAYLVSQVISAWQTDTFYLSYLSGQYTALGLYALVKFHVLEDAKIFFRAVFWLFTVYWLLQVGMQLFVPEGVDLAYTIGDNREFFLGRKNIITPYSLFVMGSFYFTGYARNRITVREVTFLLSCGILTYFTSSSTAVICYVVFMGFILLGKVLAKFNVFKRSYIVLAFSSYVGLMSALLFFQSSLFSVMAGLLGKNATFSGRTNIWELALQHAYATPVFGAGLDLKFEPWANGVVVNSAHNVLLDVLARFGVLTAVLLFIMFLIVVIGKYQLVSKPLIALFMAQLFGMLTETTPTFLILMIMSTVFYMTIAQKGEEYAPSVL